VIGCNAEKEISKSFAAEWVSRHHVSETLGFQTRLHILQDNKVRFDRITPATGGQFHHAQEDDLELAATWCRCFDQETREKNVRSIEDAMANIKMHFVQGCLFFWKDQSNGELLSMAAYKTTSPEACRICMVYTPSQCRGKGYASNLVAHLANYLVEQKAMKVCTIATDIKNKTSNAIYQNIGFTPVVDFDEYYFGSP